MVASASKFYNKSIFKNYICTSAIQSKLNPWFITGITPQYIYISYIIVGALRPDAEGSHKVGTLINKKYSSSIVITPKSVNEVVRLNTIRAFSRAEILEKASRNHDKSSNKYSSDF